MKSLQMKSLDEADLTKFREELAAIWEERLTEPKLFDLNDPSWGYPEKIRKGEKLPLSDKWMHGCFMKHAQDWRFSFAAIEILEMMMFEGYRKY